MDGPAEYDEYEKYDFSYSFYFARWNKMNAPEGKFLATVKVGEKGQIVIPKGARDLFNIQPGDTLLLLADKQQGIALVSNEAYTQFANAIFAAQRGETVEEEKK